MSDDVECDSCMSKVQLKDYDFNFGLNSNLCSLCAGSFAGTLYAYHRGRPEQMVASTACYIGNEILKELRKGKS
jgi:hypothetical protein